MKKKIFCLIACCLILLSTAFSESDFQTIPQAIDEETLNFSVKTAKFEAYITGVRFDLDDENMPVLIIKQKIKNISKRSENIDIGLWPFSHNPFSISGSPLIGSNHYTKEYLGATLKKSKKGKVTVKRDNKHELKPGEEYEFESVYQIDNFEDPIYMYYPTKENDSNWKWINETISIIPETGEVVRLNYDLSDPDAIEKLIHEANIDLWIK